MQITKEFLQKRVSNYEAQKEQIVAQLNACIGIISEAKALIVELDKPDEQPKEKENKTDTTNNLPAVDEMNTLKYEVGTETNQLVASDPNAAGNTEAETTAPDNSLQKKFGKFNRG